MPFSPYFSDEDLETQLRLQFEVDEMFDMDFSTIFNQIVDNGKNKYYLRLRNREFLIDKISGSVEEILE